VLGVSELASNLTIVGCAYDFSDFNQNPPTFVPMQNVGLDLKYI